MLPHAPIALQRGSRQDLADCFRQRVYATNSNLFVLGQNGRIDTKAPVAITCASTVFFGPYTRETCLIKKIPSTFRCC